MFPYNEIAKIYAMNDIQNFEKTQRKLHAISVFNDMRDFFDNPERTLYLITILSKKNLNRILDEIHEIFLEIEDYERCQCILEWRKKYE